MGRKPCMRQCTQCGSVKGRLDFARSQWETVSDVRICRTCGAVKTTSPVLSPLLAPLDLHVPATPLSCSDLDVNLADFSFDAFELPVAAAAGSESQALHARKNLRAKRRRSRINELFAEIAKKLELDVAKTDRVGILERVNHVLSAPATKHLGGKPAAIEPLVSMKDLLPVVEAATQGVAHYSLLA